MHDEGGEKPTCVKNIRLTPTLAHDLRVWSFRHNRAEAAIMRDALAQYFARQRAAAATARKENV